MSNKTDIVFAEWLRDARRIKHLSQQDVADMCGLTRGTIMHIENGNQRIYLFQAAKILRAFNIEIKLVERK